MSGVPHSGTSGFGPADPTDNRELLDWSSKYPAEARREIRCEAIYLGSLLMLVPLAMVVLWLRWPQASLGIPPCDYDVVLKYALAWLGGTLGGVLFDLKWLYHSVARQKWHMDRRLWRVFTPHISGGLAFSAIALIESNVLQVFDPRVVGRSVTVVGFSFLVGYFSDSAIAKLGEVADTLFGPSRSKERITEAPDRTSGRRRSAPPSGASTPGSM